MRNAVPNGERRGAGTIDAGENSRGTTMNFRRSAPSLLAALIALTSGGCTRAAEHRDDEGTRVHPGRRAAEQSNVAEQSRRQPDAADTYFDDGV